jgi:hypothetical protein
MATGTFATSLIIVTHTRLKDEATTSVVLYTYRKVRAQQIRRNARARRGAHGEVGSSRTTRLLMFRVICNAHIEHVVNKRP